MLQSVQRVQVIMEKERELSCTLEKLEVDKKESEAERDGLLHQLQEAEQEKFSVSAKLDAKVAEFEAVKAEC